MADAHANFAYSTIRGTDEGDTSNPGTGLLLTVAKGDGTKFPPPPFNATVWPTASQPTSTNAEIIRVTDVQDDTFTILRQQEGSGSRSIVVGNQIAASITAKTLTDAEAPITYWAPVHVAGVGQTGLQTIAANSTSVVNTNSLFVFPVTTPPDLQFNQILIGASLAYSTTTIGVASNTYISKFGLYSMNGNSALSLISSNYFSITEAINSRTLTWSFPTTTMTSGYGYGVFNTNGSTYLSTTGLMSSFISGTRIFGLQFGGDMSLTGGVYYIGLLSLKNAGDTRSTHGLHNAGIIGQPINTINMVSGSLVPIGSAASAWSGNNTNLTQWWGRHVVGILTNTGRAGFAGTAIPTAITLSELGTTGGAGSTATILPTVTFVST